MTLFDDSLLSWATVSTVFMMTDETARKLVIRVLGKAKKEARKYKGLAAAEIWKQIVRN
jgi:hypothetical protein